MRVYNNCVGNTVIHYSFDDFCVIFGELRFIEMDTKVSCGPLLAVSDDTLSCRQVDNVDKMMNRRY